MGKDSRSDILVSNSTRRVFKWLHGLSYWSRFSVTALSIVVLAFLDAATGYEFGFSFFYLIPVAFSAWFISNAAGLWISLLCGAIWGVLDVESGHIYSNGLFPIWNSIMRIGFYLVTVKLLGAVKYAFEQQRILSQTDFLTGLYNRRSMYDFLDRALIAHRRGQQQSVVAYIDLDNFKKLNDSQGHNEGDRALKLVSGSMLKNLRRTDFVGRMGGDEFMIVFPHLSLKDANQVLSKLNEILLVEMHEQKWPITFSIGALAVSSDYKNVDDLIFAVDQLMYQAKTTGKNSIRSAAA